MKNSETKYPVTIIGVGPGAFDLLTIRAWRIIQQADLILYDDLAGDDILSNIPEGIEMISVGRRYKDKQHQAERMNKIKSEYKKGIQSGKKIVRLKGGDPMVFARTAEEIKFLYKENIDFDIVPGITAGLAAANLTAIPLTIREKIRNLVFTTLSVKDESQSQFRYIEQLLELDAALIIYMGINLLKDLLGYLVKHNNSAVYMVAVSNASRENQQSISGDIIHLFHAFDEYKFETPSVIILSKHIKEYI